MKAGLILVGTELLNGGMVDTNSLYMAEELNKYGIEITGKFIVRDDIDDIIKMIRFVKESSDLVILSGGLGPTMDDVTKEAIAKYVGKPLIIDPEELEELKGKFKNLGIEFLDSNLKEVEKPEGAVSFKNDAGMAPAIFIDGIAAFPGVPKELYNMFTKFLKYYSKINDLKDEIYIKDLLFLGIPESHLDNEIKDLFTEPDIFYEFLVKDYGIIVRLQSKASNKNKVEKIVEKIYNRQGSKIYGEDDERLESILLNLLEEKGYTFSTAESCTGGLLSSRFINTPGASKVFMEGIVAYSNQAKIERLGVKKETLEKFGAVSEETAREMLDGLKSDVAISVTGIAGPEGGTTEKPVGLVYIGYKIKDDIFVEKHIFKGDRERIRTRSVLYAMFALTKLLKKGVKE